MQVLYIVYMVRAAPPVMQRTAMVCRAAAASLCEFSAHTMSLDDFTITSFLVEAELTRKACNVRARTIQCAL